MGIGWRGLFGATLFLSQVLACPAFADICEDAVTMRQEETRALGARAAELFQRAERELETDVMFSGIHGKPIDRALASELREIADQLSQIPGDHGQYIALFRELSDVLAGSISPTRYRRAGEIGLKDTLAKASLLHHWTKLEDTSRYEALGGSLYLKVNGLYHGSFQPDLVAQFIANATGPGLSRLNTKRSNDQIRVEDFILMSRIPGSRDEMLRIRGYHVTLLDTKKTRTVVREALLPRISDQFWYFSQMTEGLQVQDRTIKLKKRLEGRGVVTVPGRVAYKIEHKHLLQLESVISAIAEREIFGIYHIEKPFTGFIGFANVDGSEVRLVFAKDPKSYDKLVLKSAYIQKNDEGQVQMESSAAINAPTGLQPSNL